jgi:transposase
MISLPAGVRIWLVAGVTDMRRGIDGLCALIQSALSADPLSGQLFIFRGRRGDRLKILWHDPEGMCLFYKRLHRGHFIWTQATDGAVLLTPAQLSSLLEGIDWRRVHRNLPHVEEDLLPPSLAT